MRSWWRAVRLPLGVAVANYWLWVAASVVLGGMSATVGFNVVRIGLMVWAGWRCTRREASGLVGAAGAGMAVMLVDHVLLKGGTFVIEHLRGHSTGGLSYLMAAGGVLASFIMFSPLVALFGLLGGLCGRRRSVRHAV